MTEPDPVITGSEFKESLLFFTDEGGWVVAFKRRQGDLMAYLDSKNVALEMMRTSDVVCFEAKLLVIALMAELEIYRKWKNGELDEQVNGEKNDEAMVVEDQENDAWYEDNRDTTIKEANIEDHGDGGLKGGEKRKKERGVRLTGSSNARGTKSRLEDLSAWLRSKRRERKLTTWRQICVEPTRSLLWSSVAAVKRP